MPTAEGVDRVRDEMEQRDVRVQGLQTREGLHVQNQGLQRVRNK